MPTIRFMGGLCAVMILEYRCQRHRLPGMPSTLFSDRRVIISVVTMQTNVTPSDMKRRPIEQLIGIQEALVRLSL